MPNKSLRCIVEININSVTSPGTWLVKRDDLRLTVSLFGQIRSTRYVSAIFPLLFDEKFTFDKVFYSAYEPSQVADCLEDVDIRIELVQESDVYEDGRLLAWYESSARDFLYPYPSYSASYGTHDRELLLERTLAFPGISPRLEFSTKTIIQQTVTPLLEPWDLDEEVATYTTATTRRSRSRTRSPRPVRRSRSYDRPTVSSLTRSRSISPRLVSRVHDICLSDSEVMPVEDRPPFVVRKVQNKLIGRKPGTVYRRSASADRKPRFSSPSGRYGYAADYLHKLYNFGTNYDPARRRLYSSGYNMNGYNDTDLLIKSPYYRYLRANANAIPSRYCTTYRDRYDRSWSPTQSQVIHNRVEHALRRDRSRERLDRLRGYCPYTSSRDSLSDLELDFELARRRNYYL